MNIVKCSNHLCEKEYSVELDTCPFCGTANPIEERERKDLIEKDKTNGGKNESPFNGIVTTIIWISIIVGGIKGFKNCITYLIFSPLAGCLAFGLLIFGIVVLCYILAAKKWAIYAWVGYVVAVALVNGYLDNDYLPYIFVGTLKLAFLFLVLQIKKDGVSAWSVIFNKKKISEKTKESVADTKTNNDSLSTEERMTQMGEEADDSINHLDTPEKPSDLPIVNEEEFASDNTPTHLIEAIQEVPPTTVLSDEHSLENNTPTESSNSDVIPQQHTNKKDWLSKLKNGKWWIYTVIVIAVLAIAWVVVFLINHSSKSELGEYVYVDRYNILHTDRNCEHIANIHGTRPIKVYSLHEIESGKWQQVCSGCVNDNQYKTITSYVVGSDNLRVLYNILSEDYNLPDYKQYILYMQDSNNRNALYKDLIKMGYMLPDYNEFIAGFGFDKNRLPLKKVSIEKSNLRLLYDHLKSDGAVKKSYEYFYNYLQDENNRRALYNTLKLEGVDVPEKYESFKQMLFEKNMEQTTKNSKYRKQCKRDNLYKRLIESGKVTESEIGTLEQFNAAIKDEASTREFYANLIRSGLFTVDELGSEDAFCAYLQSDFEK